MDLEEIIRGQMKSYDQLEELLNEFLGNSFDDDEDEEEENPRKKLRNKKSKYKGDI